MPSSVVLTLRKARRVRQPRLWCRTGGPAPVPKRSPSSAGFAALVSGAWESHVSKRETWGHPQSLRCRHWIPHAALSATCWPPVRPLLEKREKGRTPIFFSAYTLTMRVILPAGDGAHPPTTDQFDRTKVLQDRDGRNCVSLGDNPHIGQIEIALFDPVDRLFNLASLTCCAKARAASTRHSDDKRKVFHMATSEILFLSTSLKRVGYRLVPYLTKGFKHVIWYVLLGCALRLRVIEENQGLCNHGSHIDWSPLASTDNHRDGFFVLKLSQPFCSLRLDHVIRGRHSLAKQREPPRISGFSQQQHLPRHIIDSDLGRVLRGNATTFRPF